MTEKNQFTGFDDVTPAQSIALLKKQKERAERQASSFAFKFIWFTLSGVGGGILAITWRILRLEGPIPDGGWATQLIPWSLAGAVVGSFMYAYLTTLLRINASRRIGLIDSKLIALGAVELQENIEENFFTKLVQINFKYIDQYYLQTQLQADKSFRLALLASCFGLLIVTAGVLLMFFAQTEPAYVTTGAGVLSEFVGALFFYLYNRTILKMSEYHQKLVITQNISLALKITDEMSGDKKSKALETIIDRLTSDVNKHLSDKIG